MAREALSARIDGENEGVPSARVDEHLAGCADCREWYAAASEQSLTLLTGATGPGVVGPDPTDAILAHATATRRGTDSGRSPFSANAVRIGLTAAGVAQIIVAMVAMTGSDFGMDAHGATMSGHHLMNETTAWSMALGVGMVVAAWWRRALPGLLVVLAVFTVVLGGYVITDAMHDDVTGWRVLSHLPVVVGLVFAAWGIRLESVRPSGRT